MKQLRIVGLDLYYEPQEQDSARLIGAACEKSVQLIQQRYGLPAPRDCRVYVLTSWRRFLFHSDPWLSKVYLFVAYPVLAWRGRAIWPHAGGMALRFGRRCVVGIKPPHLIEKANRGLGQQFFLSNRDAQEKTETVTCHELVHAFAAHLKLPTWLNEGLATLAMEHYLGRHIVRPDTLDRLAAVPQPADLNRARRLRIDQPQDLILQYIWGYWLTRYIDESKPELLRALLSQRRGRKAFEEALAAAFGKSPQRFQQEIHAEVLACFR